MCASLWVYRANILEFIPLHLRTAHKKEDWLSALNEKLFEFTGLTGRAAMMRFVSKVLYAVCCLFLRSVG